MKIEKKLPVMPQEITVKVRYGKSGCLLAELPEYDIFTEADNINQLFLQVNDLIYTYFDLPKKYHNSILYFPPTDLAKKLSASNHFVKHYNNITLDAFYTKELYERIYA